MPQSARSAISSDAFTAIDVINHATMRAAVAEYSRMVADALVPAESQALDSVMDRIQGRRILDLGIGAGRTIEPLCAISADYVGVDYAPEMVAYCRDRFPGIDIQQGDARSLPQFADASFDLIVFSCNGICMVDHAGRLAILREAHRLLAPGGVFIFSTRNRDSRDYRATFIPPDYSFSFNPVVFGVRTVRFVVQTGQRIINRLRYRGHALRTPSYAVINDVYHHYRVMLYFITLPFQREQLSAAGFRAGARAYDESGKLVSGVCTDGTLTLVAEKI